MIPFMFGFHMLASLEPHFGYTDGVSRSTQNLSFVGWAIFSPSGELVSQRGICFGHSTNNAAEYSAVVELLYDVISHGIHCLVVTLDSQLMVLQVTNIYSHRSPTILRMFLRVRLLERHFNFIQYEHISRNMNTLTNALANHVLDKHFQQK